MNKMNKNTNENIKLINIGKQGVTNNLIDNINDILKKYKQIKLKIINDDLKDDKKEIFNNIALKTKSKVLKVIGFTCILIKGK